MSVDRDLHARSVREVAEGAEPSACTPCPVCDARTAVPRFEVEGCSAPMVVCTECGLGRFDPMPGPDEVMDFYPDEYYGQAGTKFHRGVEFLVRIAASRQVAFASRDLPPGGRVLDVGCGRGVLLGPLADRGFEVHGVELREEAVQGIDPRAQVRIVDHLKDAAYAEASFDQVVIWHVLEHLSDPRGTLEEAHRILRPGGRLVVAVPNLSSLQARWAGPAWFHLDAPRHLTHFSRESLGRLLRTLGFELVSEHHFSLRQNPFGWIQSALNFSRVLPRNGLYTLLHERAQRAPAPYTPAVRRRMVFVGVLLAPLALLASVGAALLRRGATFHVVARKLA